MHPYSVEVVFEQGMYRDLALAPLSTRISLVLVGAVPLQRQTDPTESTNTSDDMSWKSCLTDL